MPEPMPTVYRGGRRLNDEETAVYVASQNSPMTGNNSVQSRSTTGGSNSKGNPVDDIAMGFGMKDRDANYYNRTAETIRRNQGEDAYNRYLQSYQYQNTVPRAGFTDTLLAGLGVPKMLGYKDEGDWYDGGGKYASGPKSSFGLLGALVNGLTGAGQKETSYYPEVDAAINKKFGTYTGKDGVSYAAADYLKKHEPETYRQMASNAIRGM